MAEYDDDLEDLLRLSLVRGLGPVRLGRCRQQLGSAQSILSASQAQLARVRGIGAKAAGKIHRSIHEDAGPAAVRRQRETIDRLGIDLVAIGDERYPRLLTMISDPPPLLYVRGRMEPTDALSLAIVGSRR
ncbi:MAG: DNA-processing protein DprA, partial [Phycisphaeraceae bacterium]|nr:DNA-processing protein DprA [Phycisphaeraceae bacterium]